jgi:CubicO group peptidase (beta-lactamase class C family)
LEKLRNKLKLPGMAAAIVKDQQIVWMEGFGLADLEKEIPVTPDTPFHLASVTKTYASTILMALVEQGDLDLDDPVSRFGIELQSRGTITVRHLFSHTSEGIPGTHYRYSGDRYGLLDRVIEQVTGKSFATNLEERIIAPLSLNNTAADSRDLAVSVAIPYTYSRNGGFVPGKYRDHVSCAAGLMASVADIAAFDIALDQHRFIRPQTQELAWTPTVSTRGRKLPYGLGWFTQTYRGSRLIWHYGWWPPHVSSLYLKVPEQSFSFIILGNTEALSKGFGLHRGKVKRSPAARLFLQTFVL